MAIVAEVTGRMVLLIPQAVKKIMDRGRREQRDRTEEAYKRFGVDVDGVVMLPRTPEVEEFLSKNGNSSE